MQNIISGYYKTSNIASYDLYADKIDKERAVKSGGKLERISTVVCQTIRHVIVSSANGGKSE